MFLQMQPYAINNVRANVKWVFEIDDVHYWVNPRSNAYVLIKSILTTKCKLKIINEYNFEIEADEDTINLLKMIIKHYKSLNSRVLSIRKIIELSKKSSKEIIEELKPIIISGSI